MKKYNNILTNKITKLAFLFSVFLCFSCKNVLQNQDNFQSIPKGKAYLVINAGDITARTIKPDSDESLLTQFTSFTLSGTGKDAGNKSLSLTVSATDIKDLYNKQILLDAGTWTFTLKAFLGNSTFTATTSDVLIEEGKANSVSFNLQTNDTKGGLSVKINFDKTNVSKVNTTLTKLDDDNDDSNDEVIDSKSQTSFGYNYPSTGLPSGYITYERLSNSLMLEAGEYRLVFEFYWNDTEKLNTFQYIVHIAEGVRTSFVKTVDLNEVFKITYNGKSSSPTAYIANGQTLVEKYSRKSEDIILPRYNRQDSLFEGWYDEEGNIITKIPHNANKNYTVTCHWRELKSGDPVTIYVNPEAEGHYGFSEEYGLESLEAAMETIEKANAGSQNHDWIIKIKGEVSGSHIITTDVSRVKQYVKSITLEGATQAVAGQTEPQDCLKGGITTATENGAVLSVQIPVPVIIKNLKITGGNNTNTGDIKGGGIYVGDGSTVTLDDGALITGNSASAGSGVYVSSGATFQMGGGAQVASDNDVYLSDGTKLFITKSFDGDVTHAATITPEIYSEGTQVLDIAPNGSGSLDVEYSVFTVTSQNEGGTTTNWTVDSEGKLTKGANGGNGGNGNLSINLVAVPGNGSNIQNLLVGKNLITQTEYEHFMKYHGDVVEGSSYKPSETGDAKNTTPAYYVSFVDAVIFCNLLSVANNLEPVYKIGERQNLPGCVADISEWIKDTSLGISNSDDKYCFAWDRTKPYNDNPYWQWDSIYDGGKLYTDESANGYRLATLDEIAHIANWNISHGFELQSSSGINEWCDAYSQNNCETGIFTANIADSSEEYFENCVTYHKHNAHEAPGDIIIGVEEVYCCGGGENFTRNLGFRVVRNAGANGVSNP